MIKDQRSNLLVRERLAHGGEDGAQVVRVHEALAGLVEDL